jgi:hypothetical protein
MKWLRDRLERRVFKAMEPDRHIVMEQTGVLGWTGSNTVFLSTSGRFWKWFETEIHRSGKPWVKVAARGSFSVNGKDYHMTQSNIFVPDCWLLPDWGLVHAGKTIVEVKKSSIFGPLHDFDYAGKRWTIDNKMGVYPRKVMIERGGQAAGEIRKVFSWTEKIEAWLPNELPDEILIMLIWIAKRMYSAPSSS